MTALKPEASYGDFEKLDIRIGRIVSVEPFPRARNPSYKLGIDVGAERIMQTSAQVTNYPPEELMGTLVVCICNFGAKNIAGFSSELLVLGAKGPEGGVILLQPRSEVAIGQPVY